MAEPAIDGFSDPEKRKASQVEKLITEIGQEKEFKTKHSMEHCIEGYFQYIARVAKKDLRVSYAYIDPKAKRREGYIDYEAPEKVVVSDNLFRSYSCIALGCSKCCWKHGFHNIFSEQEFQTFEQLYGYSTSNAPEGYEPFLVTIDGKSNVFFSYDHTKEYCKHLDAQVNGCGVHEFNPIHCAFPLMKFKKVKGTTFVTREPFGRNWNMKCPAKFEPMTKEGMAYTKKLLTRVKNVAEEIGVETHIDSILKQVHDRNQQLSLL